MYTGIITVNIQNKNDLALFVNPSGNTKTAKIIVFSIDYDFTESSSWEIYLNPTVTSNGTVTKITAKYPYNDLTNSINLYSLPVISKKDKLLRRFIFKSSFSSNTPFVWLEPGNSLLLSKVTDDSGKVTNTWKWTEV